MTGESPLVKFLKLFEELAGVLFLRVELRNLLFTDNIIEKNLLQLPAHSVGDDLGGIEEEGVIVRFKYSP